MQLTEKTLTVLKNFASINQSLEFRQGNILKTVSPLNTILASIEVEEEFPRTFPIYEVNRLLGTLSLFENPDLDFTDKEVLIRDAQKQSSYKYCGSSEMFNTPPDKVLVLPDPEVEFRLTKDTFKKVMNASNVLSLPEIAVRGNEGVMSLVAVDTANDSSDTFSYEVGPTNQTFQVVFKAENLKLLEGDYLVRLSSKRISHFKRESDTLQYWIAMETNSSFETE